MLRIGIIGAGLCGRLVALNLLRHAGAAVRISLIDRRDASSMGPAYSDDAEYLLLNVPACRMAAVSDDPAHFLGWARERGIPAEPWDFLPRRLYREYVLELLREAQRSGTTGATLEHVQGEVTDLEPEPDGVRLHLRDRAPFRADRVVLALGNFAPRDPPIPNRAALRSPRYARNPWAPGLLDPLTPGDTVFLIGTGQTTTDLLVGLNRRGHQGRIVAISRRGLLPLPHRGFEEYASFFGEIERPPRTRALFDIVRKHFARAEAGGADPRSVIDSLRPHTATLWVGLEETEKRRFLRHVFRYWEVHRSRIPPQSQAVIDEMRASGQLRIVAGRLQDLVETERGIQVRYAPRDDGHDSLDEAALVVNCIGPESDCRRIDHPLIVNLLARGSIRPGPAALGIDARPDGAIIGRDGAASPVLSTLGPAMKGVLWEVIAVQEIRVQAEQLAQRLLAIESPARAAVTR